MRRKVGLAVVLSLAAGLLLATPPGVAGRRKPAAPTNLTATGGDARVTLGWTASTSSRVVGYRVYRQNPDGTWPSKWLGAPTTVTTSNTAYVDTGLTNGTTYTYRVAAVNSSSVQSAYATASATPSATPTSGPCGTASAPPSAGYQHVVWIVMENKSYGEIIGSSSAPYLNKLAAQCGVASNFHAETHPSLPNYIAMTSGSTQGITDDNGPSSHPLGLPSIFSQLDSGGWRSLEESMPSNCYLTNSNPYAVRHNPAAYYTSVRTACNTYDVPLGTTPDISARFTFVTPNLCNDMHDCSVQTGDTWLWTFLPKIFGSSQYKAGNTVVFITWDEDDSSAGNHIATLVASPTTRPGTVSSTSFTHYSMLRTTEEILGLSPLLGGAASAPSMRTAFNL
jgi:phosphatidylinositol-3-phosphatase